MTHELGTPEPRTLSHPGAQLPGKVRALRTWAAVALGLGVVAVVLSTYWNIEQELGRTLEQKLSAVLETNQRATERWLDEQALLASRVARDPRLVAALAPGGQASPSAALSPLVQAGLIQRYEVLPIEESTRVSRPLSPELLARAVRLGSAVEAAAPGSPAVWAGRVVVLGRVGTAEAPRGFVILCVDPNDAAAGISTPAWGQSGRTWAFDSAGHVLTRRALPASAPGNVGALARAARELAPAPGLDLDGSRLGADRVGAFVWLERARLGLAVDVERAEAHASMAVLRRAFFVLAVMLLGALLGSLALSRWTLRLRQESALVSQRLGRLARAIQPLSAALEHDSGAVVLVDEEGSVVYANAAARSILGVEGPLIGKSAVELFENLHSELRDAVVSGVEAIVAQKPGQDDETLLVTSRPLRIEGKPHIMYSLRPVTREVRRQEVEHWKKLIRVLSHELNNTLAPITSLVSSARTLNDQHFHDAKLDKILDAISERTTHLVSFLESYRTLARLPRPSPRTVEWKSFLEGVHLQRPFVIRGELPREPGYFDPIQLERVLINALDNAVEAGSPIQDVELSVSDADDGALLEIFDRGSGMTEPVLRQAMLPFFSTKASGTGVGLALSREIVEAHGGQMTLANREGGGLVVSIFLPPARPPALSERSFPSLTGSTLA